MSFETKREKINQALKGAGITEILTKKNAIPAKYPAAIVILSGEEGDKAVVNKYVTTKLSFDIYLITPFDVEDPDKDIYDLKESFRTYFQNLLKADFKHVKYYDSKVKGTKDVKVAFTQVKVK